MLHFLPHNLDFSKLKNLNQQQNNLLNTCEANLVQLQGIFDGNGPLDHTHINVKVNETQSAIWELEKYRQVDPKLLACLQRDLTAFQQKYEQIGAARSYES